MPEAIIKRQPAQKLRASAVRRKDRAQQGRKERSGTTEKRSAIIADSIFGLKLSVQPGIAVDIKLEGKKSWVDDNYPQMYQDLLGCLHHALNLLGKPSNFDPLASGLSLSNSLYYVTNAFKNAVLPTGYEMNIDKDDEHGYYFTIFKVCDFQGYWHTFEVKPIARKLKNNPKLHKLFIDVISCMWRKADICTWWAGGLGYADYMVDEQIDHWDSNGEFEDEEESMKAYQKALACQQNYESGEVKHYQELVQHNKYKKPEVILKQLAGFRSNNRIANWLKEACEFLKLTGSIFDFVYHENEDEEGVNFDQQSAIIWEFEDYYFKIQAECLDAEAQGVGVKEPTINIPVTKNLKSFDFKEMEQRSTWPMALNKLYQSHNDLLQSFKRKRK